LETHLEQKSEESFHEEGSPYAGLSLSKQLALSKWRRGNRKPPKVWVKTLHKATTHDYAALLNHCVSSLIWLSEADVQCRMDRIKVHLKLPFNYRSHYGKKNGARFPRPVILAYFDWYTIVEMDVNVVVDYLYTIGESAFTSKQLRKELWAIKGQMDRWQFLEDYSVPLCVAEFFGEAVSSATLVKDKSKKGRRSYRKSGLHKKPKPPEDSSEEMLDKAVEGDV